MPEERLQRALARAGLGSRRACEELIDAGRVTINGRIAELGDRVEPEQDEVRVDGERVPLNPELRYFALHKPAGVLTTMRDPAGRSDVAAYLPGDVRDSPLGRLDRAAGGPLLLT